MPAQTMRLKLDLRPPTRESIVDAELEAEDAAVTIDDAVECAEWAPIAPGKHSIEPLLTFVDGVQQIHARVFAEVEEGAWPAPGMVASCAAGAVAPWSEEPIRFMRIDRCVIVAGSEPPPPLTVRSHTGEFGFRPLAAAGEEERVLDQKLRQLRADLELDVVHLAMAELPGVIVVDGRLPPVVSPSVVGLIKTPHRIELTKQTHMRVLAALRRGQRTPIYMVKRSERCYYRWFTCLRTPGPHELAQQGLAVLEMDDSAGVAEVQRVADCTSTLLCEYASSPARDARAPQNLLPVGRLEDTLRRRLGDSEQLRRGLLKALAEEAA
jgi:hypothetical protein